MFSCPHCATALLPHADRCPECNRFIADAAATQVIAPPPIVSVGAAAPTPVAHGDLAATVFLNPEATQVITATSRFDALDDGTDATRVTSATVVAAPTPAASAQDSGPLGVGQGFGRRYHIIRVLGIGGMGAVYHAWDADLGMAVALKVIRPEATRDPAMAREMERRFKQELVLARQVTHKNVVRIHDLGEIDGIKYITMPYLEGEDLATKLRRIRKMDVPSALRVVRDVAAGLAAAHEAGIVHRDLKPANIMVLKDHAVIMDFGIARSAAAPAVAEPAGAMVPSPAFHQINGAAAATVVGTVLGTVQYMAPEQAKGQPVDQRADIYALGLIFLDVLLGKRHMTGADVSAIDELNRRMATAPAPARTIDPAIPEAIERFISRCLEPDPAARFQTSADLVAELNRLDENGVPIPVKRVVGLPLMAAVVATLLSLTGGIWWYQRQLIPEAPRDPVTVVIADLRNSTGNPTFDNTLGQSLRRGLEGASFISAFDRSRIRATFGVQPPERLDESSARDIAAKQGLGVVLSGAIARRGNGYEISLKAVETFTGKEITSVSGRASNDGEVLDATTRLMTSVRSALGDKTSESAQLLAMRSVTASLDVLGHYASAVEAQARGEYEAARQSYLKAVELDPKFGLGYQGLAVMSRNLGLLEDSDKYIKEALNQLDAMTERERFGTRGFYYRMIGDNQQCAAEYGALLAKYPADTVALNQRAVCLAKLRNMREATEQMRQAVRMLPYHTGYRSNLALLANLSGDFEGAEREMASIEQPDTRGMLALAYSQVGRGGLPEATAIYEKLATMGTAGASSAASGLGDLAVYQGRFADGVRLFERGAAADLAAKAPDRAAIKFTSAAYAHLASGQHARAIAAAERALEHSKAMPVRFLAARTFVDAGAIAKARPLAAALSAELPAEPQAHGKIIEGQIALASGNAREAIRILGEANALLDTWIGHFELGRAYLEIGAFLQADSEFDRCMARRGEALSLMDEGPTYGQFPAVYYYQGRVREGMKTASFADAYRAYLAIRGQSADDPLVREVRRRVATE